MLNSAVQYLVNNSGQKYQLPIIVDMFSDFRPNVNGPKTVASKGVAGFSYTVMINTNMEPGDFTVEVIEFITTPNDKVFKAHSNSPKLKVLRRPDLM